METSDNTQLPDPIAAPTHAEDIEDYQAYLHSYALLPATDSVLDPVPTTPPASVVSVPAKRPRADRST